MNELELVILLEIVYVCGIYAAFISPDMVSLV
jgi:hypothetical protein